MLLYRELALFQISFSLSLTVMLGGCGLVLELTPKLDEPAHDAATGDGSSGADGSVADAGEDAAPVDGGREDVGTTDGGEPGPCEGAADGTACGSDKICIEGACQRSECGDGYIDDSAGEECDEVSFTCSDCRSVCNCPDVSIPCLDHFDCASGSCEPVYQEGGACITDGGSEGTCEGDVCVTPRCGDLQVDPEEECDDGNDVPNDGCEPDCTYSCEADSDCDDANPCNGNEACEIEEGRPICVAAPSVEPVPQCYICDTANGTYFPDADGDGFAANVGQVCDELDCDDDNALVNPDARDYCNNRDDDCDLMIDEDAMGVICGVDMDGDGFPRDAGSQTMPSCTACPDGMAPVLANSQGDDLLDCYDEPDEFGPNVHPGQHRFFSEPYCDEPSGPGNCDSWDYNCDGVDEQQFEERVPNCNLLAIPGCRGSGWFEDGPPPCGAEGQFATCNRTLGLFCEHAVSNRTQACR